MQVFSKHLATIVDSRKSASERGVGRQPGLVAVAQVPERGDNNRLRARGDQLPEGLGEGQVPADEQAQPAEGRVEGDVRIVLGARQVRPLGVPQVLLLVGAGDGAVARDEVGHVVQLLAVLLHDRPRHDAHVELLGQRLVGRQVGLGLRRQGDEFWVVGDPVCEVVFW